MDKGETILKELIKPALWESGYKQANSLFFLSFLSFFLKKDKLIFGEGGEINCLYIMACPFKKMWLSRVHEMTEYEDTCSVESKWASYTAKNSVSFINVKIPAYSSCNNVRNNCWSSSTCCYCF